MEVFFEYFFGVHGGVLNSYLSSCSPWHGAYVSDKFMSVLPSGFLLLQPLAYLFFTISSSSCDVCFQQLSAFCSETLAVGFELFLSVVSPLCWNCLNYSSHE